MAGNQDDGPDIPYVKYRSKKGNAVLWAKRMPSDFNIEIKKGLVDQRKAGAQTRVQYVQRLKGNAGDYLVIADPNTGARTVLPGQEFEKAFLPAEPET